MSDTIRTIVEGILNLLTHGGAMFLIVGSMLAIVLLTAWFDVREQNRHPGHRQIHFPTDHERRQDGADDRKVD